MFAHMRIACPAFIAIAVYGGAPAQAVNLDALVLHTATIRSEIKRGNEDALACNEIEMVDTAALTYSDCVEGAQIRNVSDKTLSDPDPYLVGLFTSGIKILKMRLTWTDKRGAEVDPEEAPKHLQRWRDEETALLEKTGLTRADFCKATSEDLKKCVAEPD